MVEREISWVYIVVAVFSTAIIFSVIFFAGFQFNNYKVNELEQKIEKVESNQRSVDLTYQLSRSLDGDNCKAVKSLRQTTLSDVRELKQEVNTYENSERIDNPRYESVKKNYMKAIIQNMLDLDRMEQDCGKKYVEFIYFYSNENCNSCEDQGTVLSFLRKDHKDTVRVHPIDTDIDISPVNYLEAYYNVTRYPTIVVEGEVYEGFQSREKVESLYNENLNRSGVDNRTEILNETEG